MRRAKIVCTLGPATSSYEQIKELIESGMNVARLNMSHGEHAVHEESYSNVRRAARELGLGVGVLADLQGPKIRLGRFAEGPVDLVDGAEFTITTEDIPGDVTICSTTHKGLPEDCNAGRHRPRRRRQGEARGHRGRGRTGAHPGLEGGTVSNNKGINLPGVAVSVPASQREGQGRPALGAAHRRGHGRRCRSCAPADDVEDVHAHHGRDGPADPGPRQGREAPGRREPRRASWPPSTA